MKPASPQSGQPPGCPHDQPASKEPAPMSRPKLAAVVTVYHKFSHAQHIVDRFLFGYGWNGRHHRPPFDVVALYVDQKPAGDSSASRSHDFPGMRLYPTIGEALTLGTGKLAVDGVILVGEHGNYPKNEKQQTLYPRYQFFNQIVEVFKRSGRSVPVFNDKHLSWNWDWARKMFETSRELDFPLMAGSSLSSAHRLPQIDVPYGGKVREVVSLGIGGVDSYDFHVLEAAQCMMERRHGGETGVVAVQAIRGDEVWRRMAAGSWQSGGWDPELFSACMCRSTSLTPRATFTDTYPTPEEMRRLVKTPVAYRIEYADGLKSTMLMMNGLVHDMTVAFRMQNGQSLSTQMYLPYYQLCNFFSPMVNQMETMFLTGKSPRPIERTLLTTGLTAAGVESLWEGQKRLETPHLAVRYQVDEVPAYWRT